MSLGFALWGRPPGSSRTRLGRPGRRPQDWSPAPRSLPKESKLSDIAHDCVRHIITARRANEDHCDSGAVLPGPSCHPHHIRAIDSLSASRRHGPAGTFHRRRLQNTRGSEALAAELLATGVGCRGAGGGPGHFVLAGSEAAQPESAGRAGHWFGGLFRLLPRGLRLPDRVDPERRGGVDGSAILDPHGGDGHFLPAAGHGRVLWARLLRWCLRARRDSGVGAAEAGPGAAAVGPRAGPAEVRLSRAGALFRPEAGGRARLRDLPVRSVRGLLSPERRPPHAPDRRRFSGSGHVHRTEVVLLKPVQVPRRLDRALGLLKYVCLGLALFFALKPAAARDFVICRFDPFVGFFRRSGAPHMLLIGGAFLVAGMFIGRPYCRYLCPYGGLLAWCTRLARRGVTITPDKELDCGLCGEACPYGAIEKMRAVRRNCLYCARCYAACPRDGELARAKAQLVKLS